MFDIPKAVESVGTAIQKIFDYGKTRTEHQSETTVIKHSRNLEKACDCAEQLIFLVDSHLTLFSEYATSEKEIKDFLSDYKKYRKKFFKYN